MPRQRWTFAAALIGAITVSAGATLMIRPFEDARAEAKPGGGMSARAQAALDQILSESEPGARVTKLPNGGFSVQGTRTPEAAAMYEEMNRAYNGGPAAIACKKGIGVEFSCEPIEAAEAVADGAKVYARTVHGAISQESIDQGRPVFASTELVCSNPDASGVLTCASAGTRVPRLGPSQTAIATYAAATITASGGVSVHPPSPTIPARR